MTESKVSHKTFNLVARDTTPKVKPKQKIELKCPKCGEEFEIYGDALSLFCGKCGTRFWFREEVSE